MCIENESDLVSITDAYHQAFLTVLVNRLAVPHWIGLYSQDVCIITFLYLWFNTHPVFFCHVVCLFWFIRHRCQTTASHTCLACLKTVSPAICPCGGILPYPLACASPADSHSLNIWIQVSLSPFGMSWSWSDMSTGSEEIDLPCFSLFLTRLIIFYICLLSVSLLSFV